MNEEKTTVLAVSYVPMMYASAGKDYKELLTKHPDKLQKALDSTPKVHGVMWAKNPEGKLVMIVIIDDAFEVVEHMRFWSSGDISDWFTVHLGQINTDRWGMLIMPNTEKSIERVLQAMKLDADTTEVKLIYKPISFISNPLGDSSTYTKIREELGDSIEVGMVDKRDVDQADFTKTDPNKIHDIGTLKIGDPAILVTLQWLRD